MYNTIRFQIWFELTILSLELMQLQHNYSLKGYLFIYHKKHYDYFLSNAAVSEHNCICDTAINVLIQTTWYITAVIILHPIFVMLLNTFDCVSLYYCVTHRFPY